MGIIGMFPGGGSGMKQASGRERWNFEESGFADYYTVSGLAFKPRYAMIALEGNNDESAVVIMSDGEITTDTRVNYAEYWTKDGITFTDDGFTVERKSSSGYGVMHISWMMVG